MTPEQFVYWLRGAMEMWSNIKTDGLNPDQVKMLEEHLDKVVKPTPPAYRPPAGSTTRIC